MITLWYTTNIGIPQGMPAWHNESTMHSKHHNGCLELGWGTTGVRSWFDFPRPALLCPSPGRGAGGGGAGGRRPAPVLAAASG